MLRSDRRTKKGRGKFLLPWHPQTESQQRSLDIGAREGKEEKENTVVFVIDKLSHEKSSGDALELNDILVCW